MHSIMFTWYKHFVYGLKTMFTGSETAAAHPRSKLRGIHQK